MVQTTPNTKTQTSLMVTLNAYIKFEQSNKKSTQQWQTQPKS